MPGGLEISYRWAPSISNLVPNFEEKSKIIVDFLCESRRFSVSSCYASMVYWAATSWESGISRSKRIFISMFMVGAFSAASGSAAPVIKTFRMTRRVRFPGARAGLAPEPSVAMVVDGSSTLADPFGGAGNQSFVMEDNSVSAGVGRSLLVTA